jgi:DNA segregation ATPase FtsK/SpoIIIE, S-DNA-T family
MGDSFTHRERLLIRHLTALVAQRAESEATAAERLKEESYRLSRAFDKESKQLNTDHNREQADSAAELTEKASKVRSKAEEDIAAAKKLMESEIGAHNARTNSIWRAAKGKWDEAVWLADTVVESGGSKIRNQYELAKRSLTPKVQDVDRIRRAAAELLQGHGHRPLAELPAASPDVLPVSVAEFNNARADAVRALHTLHSRVRPVIVRWPIILLFAVVAAIAGGAIRIGWPIPTPLPLADAAVSGGASALGAVILVLVLRLLLRRRVSRAAAATAQVLDRARLQGEGCLKAAEKHRDDELTALQARRDADLNKAKEALTLARNEVDRRIQVEAVDLKKAHENKVSTLEQRRDSRIAAFDDEHNQRLRAAKWRFDQSLAAATQKRDRSLAEVSDEVDARLAKAEHAWKSGLEGVHGDVADIATSPEGSPPVWQTGDYIAPMESPTAVRFGQLTIDIASLPGGLSANPRMRPDGPTSLSLPSFLDLTAKASLLVQSSREERESAIAVLRMVMSRLLTGFPPGKVRFTIVDPIGLGRSFAGFMHLADHEPALVSDRIWTDPRHIEQKLTDLTEHMENVIQKYLRNEYATIQEYNAQAGEVAEPYRFLVIADFPVNLTENAAKKLWSIITSGPRCGVYTLIAESLDRQVPAYVPLADLERSSVRLVRREGKFIWQEEDFSGWPLALDTPPDDDALTKLLNTVGALSKDATRVQVPFEMIAPQESLWPGDSSEELRLPLGRAGAKKLQHFALGRGTTQHALIAGRTGSGKSTLLHVLITNLALWYSPDEVEMYLVDFKKGVEFKTYATHRLPHARVIAVESEREFGLSVLKKLDAELTRRGTLFREAGAQDLAGYRRSGGGNGSGGAGHKILPRVLLIVDEFQEFFVEDDKIAQEASLLMDRLVRQGRAFGMHVVLGSQTLGGAYSIARATIGQMAVRIALQCSESDAYLIMSEDNAAPRLLSRPGEAIYNDASGLVEGNSPFQIVWLPEAKREKYLEAIRTELVSTHRAVPPAAVVFEGNIPAQIATNHLLARVLSEEADAGTSPRAWLGDAISIKDPTAAVFQRQSGSHMLIVGQQEDSALALLTTSAVALAAHGSSRDHSARLVFLDASPVEPGQTTPLELLSRQLPNAAYGGIRGAVPIVSEVHKLMEARAASDSAQHDPVYVFIYAMHRFRDLRKSDDYSYSSSEDQAKNPAQQFAAILREGPPLGIHILAWSDTVASVERTLERSSLREFDNRVLFQMSGTDSTQLIDSPVASTLGRHRALLYREQLGVPEKFRPYAMPDQAWLDQAAAAIRARVMSVASTGQRAS